MNTTEKKLVRLERIMAAVLFIITAALIWAIYKGSLAAVALVVIPAACAAWLMEDADRIKANAKQRDGLRKR